MTALFTHTLSLSVSRIYIYVITHDNRRYLIAPPCRRVTTPQMINIPPSHPTSIWVQIVAPVLPHAYRPACTCVAENSMARPDFFILPPGCLHGAVVPLSRGSGRTSLGMPPDVRWMVGQGCASSCCLTKGGGDAVLGRSDLDWPHGHWTSICYGMSRRRQDERATRHVPIACPCRTAESTTFHPV